MNIHTKKRTCKGCAAARHNKCDLGYSAVFSSDEPTFVRAVGTPQEKCPKPRNNKEYFEALNNYKRSQMPRAAHAAKMPCKTNTDK